MNRQLFYFSSILQATLVVYMFSSCVVPGQIDVPYMVPDERQHENLYYVPSAPNTMLSSEKNQFDFNVIRSSGARYTGIDLQAGYMATKNIGLIAGYSTAKNNSSPDHMNFKRYEFGAGYVVPIAKRWHFETYAGGGKGKIDNHHFTGYSNVDLTHYFIQPAFAFKTPDKSLELGIISRFSGVNFNVKDMAFDRDREKLNSDQFNILQDQPFHLMWEPGFIARTGWKNFKFHLGYSLSTDLTNSDLHRSNGNLSLGMSLQFYSLKK